MKFERRFFTSRVARQIFSKFIVSAMAPIVVLSGLYYWHQQRSSEAVEYQRLKALAKDYGTQLYDRLLLTENALTYLTLAAAAGQTPPAQVAPMILSWRKTSQTEIAGDAVFSEKVLNLSVNEVLLHRYVRNDAAPALLMIARLSMDSPDVLLAELNQMWLLDAHENLPAYVGICVLYAIQQPAFCSAPELVNYLGPMQDSHVDAYQYLNKAGNQYRAVSWSLYLKPRYQVDTWHIVALQTERMRTDEVILFDKLIYISSGLALLLVIWLALMQIRRSLVPLTALQQGTQKITANEFNHRIDIRSNDEFAQLADSFNHMAGQLGSQFRFLQGLANIDRLILNTENLDATLTAILPEVLTVIERCNAVVLLGALKPISKDVFFYHFERGQTILEVQALPDFEVAVFNDFSEIQQITRAQFPEHWQIIKDHMPGNCFFIEKIKIEIGLILFVLSMDGEQPLLEFEIRIALDLAERIKVALTARTRDQQLEHLAYYDQLTDLPGRQLLLDRLQQAIAVCVRENQQGALLFIDLDRFKNVNDTYGHPIGDALLRQVAATFRAVLRESDTVARFGGDEFVVVLPNLTDIRDAGRTARKLIEAVSQAYFVGELELYINASIGISLFPTDAQNADVILRNADTAMYRAKDGGRGRYEYYHAPMNTRLRESIELERELRYALELGELEIYYQPQVTSDNARVIGVEALLRWRHKKRGLISPARFIPLAEDSGLIMEIGRWVLQQACRQISEIESITGIPLRVAVNFSPVQFTSEDIVGTIMSALQASGLPAAHLEVEITENVVLIDYERVDRTLRQLRDYGVGIAIDDFGTGYSSLGHLRKLPFTAVKVDRSFVMGIEDPDDQGAIVAAIVSMAHSLNMQVIAEGVENQQQLEFLRRIGCDLIQGYLVSMPLNCMELRAFITERLSVKQSG